MVGIKPSLINYDKYSTKLQIYCLYFSIISSHLISIVSIIKFFLKVVIGLFHFMFLLMFYFNRNYILLFKWS